MRERTRRGTATFTANPLWPVHRLVAALVLTAFVAAPLALLPASPASAAASFDVPPSDFVTSSSVTLTGSKDAGSTLVIRRGEAVVCTITDPDTIVWQCSNIAVPNGVLEFSGDETLADASVVPISPLTLRVLASPALDGAGGTLITTGRFSGSAQPGAIIQLTSTGPGGTQTHSCPAAIDTGFWSCVVASADLPSGAYQVRARQSSPAIGPEFSNDSTAVNAVVDRTVPSAPTITSPQTGLTTLATGTARGGGERDALLQVFANGELTCETIVSSSGSWACPVQWPRAGTYTIQALQQDVAGNFSAVSDRVEVRYAPTQPRGNVDSPGSPRAPAPAPPPDQGAAPAPTPEQSGPGEPVPAVPPTPGSPSPPPPAMPGVNWGTATGFGGALPTAEQVVQRGGWLIAPLVGLAYLLLAALPLRAFAIYVLPRLRRPRIALTGRNRVTPLVERAPIVLSPLLVAAGTLGGAAIIAALSGGVDSEVRYVRLTAAIGLGLLLLNVVAVLVPARIAGRVARVDVVVRLLPGILLVALLAALVSRFGGLQPPLLVGVLIAATAAAGSSRRSNAGIAVAQTSGVAALAVLGWVTHDVLTPSTGFWMSFASETAAAVALGGLGSLLMLLLPVGPLPGRALFAVSPPAWAVFALVAASVAGAILASGPAFPIVGLVLVGAGFAGLLSAAAVWVRWVGPALR